MKLPRLPLAAVLPAAKPGLATGCGGVPARALPRGALPRSSLAVSGSEHDLELVELVPFGIGPLPLRNGEKLLQAGAG
ncbi:MAG: hypothetical protein HYY78_20495 [Betaproteobacteria bacterium]|nr:hypothetical protein [Betaproteobacteria bacterium]